MSTLKQRLFTEYNGFADHRIKDLKKSSRFIIDDRSPNDIGADGRLKGYFCSIFLDVVSENEVALRLTGNIPTGPKVVAWIARIGNSSKWENELAFSIKRDQVNELEKLAAAIESIVAPGAPRYDEPSYKYVCPRTAASLQRIAEILEKAWG